MASVHRCPGGGYRVAWREGGKQRTQRVANKRDAAALAREIGARLQRPVGGLVTLQRAAQMYAQQRRSWATGDEWAEKDKRTLGHAITSLEATGAKHCADVKVSALQALPIGQFRLAKAALRAAARDGAAVDPAALTCPAPRRSRSSPPPLVTPAQVAAATAAALAWGTGEGLAVHLVATYGHRPHTVARLQVKDYDQARGHLVLSIKEGGRHRHPISAATVALIEQAAKDQPPTAWLCRPHHGGTWGKGQPLVDWYYRTIGPAHHGHDPGIYALKRYAITHMLDLGLTPETIASITGHRTTAVILNTYARTNEERQAAAIAAISAS